MFGTVPRHSFRSHLLSSTFSPVLRSTLSQRINPSSGGDTTFSHSAWNGIEPQWLSMLTQLRSSKCSSSMFLLNGNLPMFVLNVIRTSQYLHQLRSSSMLTQRVDLPSFEFSSLPVGGHRILFNQTMSKLSQYNIHPHCT